jgi:hypothetical protein
VRRSIMPDGVHAVHGRVEGVEDDGGDREAKKYR